jgi:hypothetical protein
MSRSNHGLLFAEKQVVPPPNVTGALHIGHGLTGAVEVCVLFILYLYLSNEFFFFLNFLLRVSDAEPNLFR